MHFYYEEIVNQWKLDRIDKIFAADYIDHEMSDTDNKSIENKTWSPFWSIYLKHFPICITRFNMSLQKVIRLPLAFTLRSSSR